MALGTNAKIELIKSAPLFENCSKQELQSIAQIADELDVRAGKVLIREGERGREFFVIVRGEVEVRRKGRKMATLGPGSFVGEMALLSKIPRSRDRDRPDAARRARDHRSRLPRPAREDAVAHREGRPHARRARRARTS